MIMMGESIRQIWVNFTVGSGADDIIHSIYKVDGDIEHLSPGHKMVESRHYRTDVGTNSRHCFVVSFVLF